MTTRRELLNQEYTPQSIGSNRLNKSINKELKQSISSNRLDIRVQGLHTKLQGILNDKSYEIAHTYKIAKTFNDADIYQVADYCQRKAIHPGKAFVTIFHKKMA